MKLLDLVLLALMSVALTSCKSAPMVDKAEVPPASSFLPISWLQVGPDDAGPSARSSLIARTVTDAVACPSIEIDGTSSAMVERGVPSAAFPAHVCEAKVPAKARAARIGGETLPIPLTTQPPRGVGGPNRKVEHVYVIGDTGCRAKVSHGYPMVQDCLDPMAWPFGTIAASIATQKPDLIIHVGDYLYRELEVPGQPFGDRLDTWLADFLVPARPLLKVAPWVFVRGNHEGCSRAGEGWRRLLDPRPYRSDCVEIEAPYWAKIGGFSIAVIDTSAAVDDKFDAKRVKTYSKNFDTVSKFPIQKAWLATHKPLWNGVQLDGDLNHATKGKSLRNYAGVVSGHAHFFGAILFDTLPAEFVTGNGGSSLSPLPPRVLDEVSAGGRRIRHAIFQGQFGYLEMVDHAAAPWHIVERNVLGQPQLICELRDTVVCEIPRSRDQDRSSASLLGE